MARAPKVGDPAPQLDSIALLDSVESGIALVDGAGLLRYFNGAWEHQVERFAGHAAATGLGQPYLDCLQQICGMSEADATALEQGIQAVLAGEQERYNSEIRCQQGWLIIAVQRYSSGSWHGLLVQQRDITQRKREEQHAREREESFRLLFSNNPQPMWVYDLDTLAFLEVNEAAVAHYGYSRDEFLSLRITDIRPQEDVARLLDDVAQSRPALSLPGRWRHKLKNGQIIHVEIVSHTLEFAGHRAALVIVQDVTERRRLEQERQLAEHERRQVEEQRLQLQQEIIRMQQAALAELSTPLLAISEQVVVMPLVGAIDSHRAQQVVTALLHGTEQQRARIAILDITGVTVVDTQVANALVRAAQAVRLLGAEVVITGIRPEIAQTLVGLGLDLGKIVTRSSLQHGIAYAQARIASPMPD